MTQPPTPRKDMLADNDRPFERNDVATMHASIMREHREPRDGYEPVPLWLVTGFGMILFWGGWYLATYSGGFRADVLEEQPEARFVGLGGDAAKPIDPMVLGQRLFTSNCVSCHQATGSGVAGLYPPLAKSEWVKGEPARVKRILLHGLTGSVVVGGKTYNSNMPSFGLFKDQQIAAILTYVRGNSEWGNEAAAISPESVMATRAATKGRTTPWTAAELLSIGQDDLPATTQPAANPQKK